MLWKQAHSDKITTFKTNSTLLLLNIRCFERRHKAETLKLCETIQKNNMHSAEILDVLQYYYLKPLTFSGSVSVI